MRSTLPVILAIAAVIVIVAPISPRAKPAEAAALAQTLTATGAPNEFDNGASGATVAKGTIIRAALAPVIDPIVAAMPVLRPPSTGDAGLMTERSSGFVPLIVVAGVLSFSAGVAWRLRPR